MKAKISFFGGFVLGLLAGSRIGPELYRRVSAGVSSLASNPQVRKGASVAGDRATNAARTAGASAAHQVKHASEVVAHQFGDRFGGRWNPVAHAHSAHSEHPAHSEHSARSATNGSAHNGAAGGFDDEDPFEG